MPLTVIRASAGSGKTYQLAVSFIRILLRGEIAGQPQNPAAILATTFTRTAAGEILDRVLRLLSEAVLSSERREALGQQIGSPLSAQHCERLLANLAAHMDRLAISTMDAFFAQIAKAFATDLGLAPDWTMAVDEGAEELLRQTLHAILGEADLRSLTEALWTYRRGVISSMLRALADIAPSLTLIGPTDDDAGNFERPQIRRWIEKDVAEVMAMLAGSERWIPRTKTLTVVKHWATAVEKLRAALHPEEDVTRIFEIPMIERIFRDEEFAAHKAPLVFRSAMKPILAKACDALCERHRARELALQWLARHYVRHRREASFSAGTYTFSDVAAMVTSTALNQDDLYFRLGTRFEHVLFDEFQDTSRQQFAFFKPIIEEIGGTGGEVLVVGDEKQAIYGWRGGDRELMHAPLEDLAAQIGSGEEKTLSESFRSSPAVLTAVNRTFQTLDEEWLDETHADRHAITDAGKAWLSGFPDHRAAEQVRDLRGSVRVIHASAAEDAADDDKNRPLVAATLELVAAHLNEDRQRKIGILLRKKNLMPRLIADIRRAHPEVDVSGEGGNPLTDSRAVEIILDLLAWLDHPGHTAARHLVLNSPLAVAFGFSTPMPADAASITDERRVLRDLRRHLIGHGYATTLRCWIRHAAFSSACSDHDLLRCEQLLEVAREFDSHGPSRPSAFAAHVRTRRIEQPGGSGVRVMTIHASKGLEFETVILLELDAAQAGSGDAIVNGPDGTLRIVPAKKHAAFMNMEALVEKQIAQDFMEELSVLYVGMTRARSFLDIVLRKDSKALLARLLRRALPADSDRVVEDFDGISMRESDEKKGRAAIAVETADMGISTSGAAGAASAVRAFEGRVMHATPSARSESGVVNVASILAPANRAAMRRGELVHSLLVQMAWIEDGLPEPVTLLRSATEIVRDFEPGRAAEIARSLIAEAQAQGTELHRTFSKVAVHAGETLELWRERRFAVLDESEQRAELLTGSFDRVVLWRDAAGNALRAMIVDFKTDRFSSAEERVQIEARYAPQLEAYRKALCLLCPGLNARDVEASLTFVRAESK